jgi:hypothetical protein
MPLIARLEDAAVTLYYRAAPWLAMSLLDDPAMLALAFC